MKLELEIPEEPIDLEELSAVMDFDKKECSNKLNLILQEYQEQKRGVGVKLKRLHSDMYVAILVFVVLLLIDSLFTYILKQPGAALLAFAWEMWVACIALFVAMWKSGMHMIKKIAEYHIHNETGKFYNSRTKQGNFTLKAEGRFCETMEKETRELLDELAAMPAGASLAKFDEIQYIEKRADAQVFGLFDQYEILWYVVMTVVFIILTVLL